MTSLASTSPLFHRSINATPLPDPIESAQRGEAPGPLPCDLEQYTDNVYRLTVAATGLNRNELSIRVDDHVLTISAQPGEDAGTESAIRLYRGIDRQPFSLSFRLEEHVTVQNARLENGLLSVELHRGAPAPQRAHRVAVNGDIITSASQRQSRIRLRGTRRGRAAQLSGTDNR